MSSVEYLGSDKPVNRAAPLVSVCVMTYQHAAFIGQCLDGILAQENGFPIEILVGEDQSTDGTREICITYAEKHPDRIRLFLNDRSEIISIDGRPTGRTNTVNLLNQARGEFIAICEGDDYWTDPSKLERQVATMREHPDCSLVFHNSLVIAGDGPPKNFSTGLVEGPYGIESVILDVWFVPTQSMLFRRALLELGRWTRHVLAFDYAMQLLLASKGRFHYLDRVMGAYRLHAGGLSQGRATYYHAMKLIETLCLFNAATDFEHDDLVKQRLEKFRQWLAKQVPSKLSPAARVRALGGRALAKLGLRRRIR